MYILKYHDLVKKLLQFSILYFVTKKCFVESFMYVSHTDFYRTHRWTGITMPTVNELPPKILFPHSSMILNGRE